MGSRSPVLIDKGIEIGLGRIGPGVLGNESNGFEWVTPQNLSFVGK